MATNRWDYPAADLLETRNRGSDAAAGDRLVRTTPLRHAWSRLSDEPGREVLQAGRTSHANEIRNRPATGINIGSNQHSRRPLIGWQRISAVDKKRSPSELEGARRSLRPDGPFEGLRNLFVRQDDGWIGHDIAGHLRDTEGQDNRVFRPGRIQFHQHRIWRIPGEESAPGVDDTRGAHYLGRSCRTVGKCQRVTVNAGQREGVTAI